MLGGGTQVTVFGANLIEAKLAAAEANILTQNKLLVRAILDEIKPQTMAQTPYGPGHFGYHAKDRFVIRIVSLLTMTTGYLLGAPQAKWREFGTRRGERKFWTAHKAASGARRVIKAYYGGMAAWWHL